MTDCTKCPIKEECDKNQKLTLHDGSLNCPLHFAIWIATNCYNINYDKKAPEGS